MTDTIVDTNVLIDITGEDPTWADWSADAVAHAADRGSLVINQVIYSELSGGFAAREDLDLSLAEAGVRKENLPWAAAYMAGMAFKLYRKRGGSRPAPLPDFYIGAHAAIQGYGLITRDRDNFRTYFPTLDIIAPDTHP